MKELEVLSQEARIGYCASTNYEDIWNDLFEDPASAIPSVAKRIHKYQQSIKLALTGQTLIDLGCGYPSQAFLETMQQTGIAKLAAVDLYALGNSQYSIHLPEIIVEIIPDEMLSYTLSLPDNSSNFMINGIDTDSASHNVDFHIALAQIVVEKTKPGGLIMTYGSTVTEFFLTMPQLAQINWRSRTSVKKLGYANEFVFQKMASPES